ncbi:MAG TPA: nucleotidyltransferase domain-containing protein [Longimicrobium sp.]
MEQAFEQLRRVAAEEPDVLGFALTGSRARGLASERSDYDCVLFVRDGRRAEYERRFAGLPAGVDLRVMTLAGFREHAAWGSPTAWDRYNWAHARIEVDRTGGELGRLAREKGRVPEAELGPYVELSLDWYLNQVNRSLRCRRDRDAAGQRLEAAESVRPLLQALFAVHDRRLVPYYKYLAWELEHEPLHKLRLAGGELLGLLLEVLGTAEPAAQGALLREAERLFAAEGYARPFQAWRVPEWWGSLFP